MPKVLIAEAEQNLHSLQEKRDRASKDLSDEATSFMANPSITPTSARRFDLVLDFLKLQINLSTEMFYKRLDRKLHDMEMIQRAMGKAEDDEDMRQLLVLITDCRLMDETIRIVERGVQAIHTLNDKDRQIHQEDGPNGSCSSQSVAMASNLIRRSNSNSGNIVSGDTVAVPPAGFRMRSFHESKVCSTGPRTQISRLGDPGKSAPGGNTIGRRGTLNLGAGKAESSQYRSAPDTGSRERSSTWYAGVSTNRPSTEVTTTAGTVAPGQGGIKRKALRIKCGRSVEVAPSHRSVHEFPVGHEPYGKRISDMALLQKPSLNCKAALKNGVEQRVCADATASTEATTMAKNTKRARISKGGFRELEKMIRLAGLPRLTVAGHSGPEQCK